MNPWYLRAMMGLAGAMAALFFLAFIAMGISFVLQSRAAGLVAGAALIGAAWILLRAGRADFSVMFALAISLAGQGLLAYVLFDSFDLWSSAWPWVALCLLGAGLVAAMPHFLHRLAAALLAGLALGGALDAAGAGALAAPMLAAAAALAWLRQLDERRLQDFTAPLGYGLTLALVYAEANLALRVWTAERAAVPAWAGEALAAAVLALVVAALARRAGWRPGEHRSLMAIAAALAVGAASFKAPGVASGLMIVLLGFAAANRLVLGLGIAALLFYLSSYYYLLEATLLVKSGVLTATGVVLLAVRWVLLRGALARE